MGSLNLVDDLGGIFGEGLERVFGCLRNVLETWNELMIYREYHMPFGKKNCPTLRKNNGAGEQCFGLLERALFCR